MYSVHYDSCKAKPSRPKVSEITKIISDSIKKIKNSFSKHEIEASAWETGFIKRSSAQLRGFDFLMSLLVAGLHPEHASLEKLSDIVTEVNHNVRIKSQSLMERINSPSAVQFLKVIQEKVLNDFLYRCASEIPAPILANFSKVLIQDSTVIELQEELQDHFKGSGGRASKSCAKIDVIYDIKARHFEKITLTDQSEADQKLAHTIKNVLESNILVIRDLGYARIDGFEDIQAENAFFLSRMRSDTLVYLHLEDEEPIDLVRYLSKNIEGTVFDMQVYITRKKFPVRLVVYKVPHEAVEKRRREAHKTAKKQGRTLRDKTCKLMEYSFFITNVAVNMLATDVIRTIYGIRWQIEILFKCWKSGIKIHYLKGIKPERIRVLIYSRLILALIVNEIYRVANGLSIAIKGQTASMYKVFSWMNAKDRLMRVIKGRIGWWEARYFKDIVLKSMCQQNRKNKTTFQSIYEATNLGRNLCLA